MNKIRSGLLTLLVSAVLVACGGGDPDVPGSGAPSGAPSTKGTFTALVSFGDSLSDVGTYAPATSLAGNGAAPYFGGKFTTNSDANTDTVWVENLAATLSLVVTPAEVGFNGSSVQCPAAANPALASTCTAYGQGGARVTNPAGIGKTPTGQGALTVPLQQQIANHLTRFTSFRDTDLIVVWGGNNDVLVQFSAFATAATQIQANAAAGNITADEANRQLFEAQTLAQGAVKQAALELAGYVKTEILAKGGKYVAVVNLPDIGDTPFGQSITSVSARTVLSDLSRLFNLWLNDGLTNQPVRLIDMYTAYKAIVATPAQYGFAVANVPACDAAKISAITGGQITDGSSLFCNGTAGAPYNGLRTGADVNTWLFADGVHPTTGGHKALSDTIAAQLASFGWI
ncbi:MAG: SGNH/GDSL hydrolase family protein [Pseudomonadota bacterium]